MTVTGGTLTVDGANSIRTFTANGTLGISGGNLSFQYLVLGAGGNGASGSIGGAFGNGGGGGGGGQALQGNTTFTANNYTITIGTAASGNSVLGNIVAVKGNTATDRSGATSGGNTGNGGTGGNPADGTAGSNGLLSNISSSNVYYGGGGGGGDRFIVKIGGNGGGGNGGTYDTIRQAQSGVVNTGGGGGGDAYGALAGTGGSGIVIIRYPTAGTN